jgi:hypothetical protein
LTKAWDLAIEAFWQTRSEDEEQVFLEFVYYRDRQPVPTYKPRVWGCELRNQRDFSFWVSDERDLGVQGWKPRLVKGEKLVGSEWEGLLRRFWRERERVEAVRRAVERFGLGPMEYLEEMGEVERGVYPDINEVEDADGESDVEVVEAQNSKPMIASGKRRRDSGGAWEGFVVQSKRRAAA